MMLGAISASAQLHFNSTIPIRPADYGLSAGSVASNLRLAAQDDLSVNVTWNSQGVAFITAGYNGGGFSTSTGDVTWEFKYNLALVQLEPGKVLMQIDWSKKSITGEVGSGTTTIGILEKNSPNEIIPQGSPNAQSGTVSHNLATISMLGSTNGGLGQIVRVVIHYEYGYFDANGTCHTVYVTATIDAWMPIFTPGDEYQA